MSITPQLVSGNVRVMSPIGPAKIIAIGLLGGLVATIVMQLFGNGMLLVVGLPVGLSFTIIGDAAAGFFSMLGIGMAGGIPLGIVAYCLIGLALGPVLSTIVWKARALGMTSMKKEVGLSILAVEMLSLPMLALAVIVLKLPSAAAAEWFGLSFVWHMVYGLVAGIVIAYGLR